MAINALSANGTFVPSLRDNLVANQAMAGFATQQPTGLANLLQGSGMPVSYDCFAQFNTTDATANEVVMDLTTRGLTLPAGGLRILTMDVYQRVATSATTFGFLRNFATISGGNGTTPVFVPNAAGTMQIDHQITITGSIAAFILATNNVQVVVTGTAATSINWYIGVYIGPLIQLA